MFVWPPASSDRIAWAASRFASLVAVRTDITVFPVCANATTPTLSLGSRSAISVSTERTTLSSGGPFIEAETSRAKTTVSGGRVLGAFSSAGADTVATR
jgi:hypothetical protein